MPIVDGKEAAVHLVPLTSGSSVYQHVLDNFQTTGGTGDIVKKEFKIPTCTNSAWYARRWTKKTAQ